jgi:hypothetical protein
MDQPPRMTHSLHASEGQSSAPSPTPAARLQAIHDLICSGDYDVPATAIAERMVERIIIDQRERES